jgi:hypothetical protein
MIYMVENNNEVVEFNVNYVEYLYSRYLPDGSVVTHEWTRADDLIMPAGAKYIVFGASNPVDVETYLTEKTYLTRVNYILTGMFRYYKNKPINSKIQFFPFWVIWMSNPYAPAMVMGDHTFCNRPKKYKVSCLNGTEWAHRKLTYIYLSQKSYFNEMIFTFVCRRHVNSLTYEVTLTQEENEQFNLLPQIVTFPNDITDIDLSINHPAYQETYINLVTETTVEVNTAMLSEKTFKPIVAGQLFVLIAGPSAIQFLRDIGIDTFDDIIDHGYDNIIDVRERIKLAIAQVDHLMTLDLEQLYNQIKPRLLRNSEYFRSEEFRQQFSLTFDN